MDCPIQYYALKVRESSLMESTIARDSTRIFFLLSVAAVLKAFFNDNTGSFQGCAGCLYNLDQSLECASVGQEIVNMSTWLLAARKLLIRSHHRKLFMGKDWTLVVYPLRPGFRLWAFAKPPGRLKYCATIQAIPMPEASIVRIFVIESANLRLNSLPISLMNGMSIWWFRKLSTFSILPGFTVPSLRIRSLKAAFEFLPGFTYPGVQIPRLFW